MNKEAQKRKDLATAYHELKKNYEILEEAYNQTVKKGSENGFHQIRLDKVPSDNSECFKVKNPKVVSYNNVEKIIEELIYIFQQNEIPAEKAI